MNLSTLYQRVALISPYIEILLRQLYWRNVSIFGRYNPNKPKHDISDKTTESVYFDDILQWLLSQGIQKGSLMVIHSSYDALSCTGLSPEEIIDSLIGFVGENGTIAMPAIRKFKGAKTDPWEDSDEKEYIYNVHKSAVISGFLPFTLMRREGSVISRHPLNPMVGFGPLAKKMMAHNIEGESPSPHGPNSSWKYCYDHDAWVIGLGVDLGHYNTIAHVAEEAFDDWRWTDEEWYRMRKFKVIDNDFSQDIMVKERKPQWGMLHDAEINAYQDILKNGIVKRIIFGDNLVVCVEKARELIDYLRTKNKKGHPYYVLSDLIRINHKGGFY